MEKFNDLLQKFYAFKNKRSYDYREWRTGGEIAKTCKGILDKIAELIKAELVNNKVLEEGEFTVESASGAGYYPKTPWIGVFKNGECATDGIYPVLGFYNDSKGGIKGCFIGCAESFTNPQFGFQHEYCRNDGCSPEEKKHLKDSGLDKDNHLARMLRIFEASSEVSEACLIEALKFALDIYKKYREKYPRRSSTLDICREDGIVAISTWYKEIYVDDVSKWLGFVTSPPTQSSDRESWIFRGQGDASWHLESLLYRYFGSIGDGADIRAIETNAIAAFKRGTYDLQLCQRLNGVNILAVMQHYGSATRLLDFTYAPLTALFFAIEQRDTLLSNARNYCKTHAKHLLQIESGTQDALEDTVSLAVWAFKLRSILGMPDCDLDMALAKSTKDAHGIVLYGLGKSSGSCDNDNGKGDDGIDVVVPKFGNERLSAQCGLFLMARNIGKSFEENLRVALPDLTAITKEDCIREYISKITDWNAIVQKFSVVKFVFPHMKVKELKIMLRSLHITYKTIYPDLMGIAKDVTAEK